MTERKLPLHANAYVASNIASGVLVDFGKLLELLPVSKRSTKQTYLIAELQMKLNCLDQTLREIRDEVAP
jgi:hypothetical protein